MDAELRHPVAAHEAALRTVQKPPAKPWRGGAAASTPPPPPKMYRVEPREFRDLVQRLTGTPPAATGRGGVARPQHHQLAGRCSRWPFALHGTTTSSSSCTARRGSRSRWPG
ncbi:hypothetical protein PVAP13_4NG291076 [Panicum virgatum]|uniref:VQ domain-containing protein n=1 Tax=Panicum virgatum TaxID=38727 RepID=A0A8T0TH68_PANVG|nr:hypothetical protein PVAP13_4NG291076 [Panicum virgatum]